MVLGSFGPDRTFWWNSHTDATRRITDRAGYNADIRADRLAVYTKDPYRGGCSVVSRLSAPHSSLWRSCRERVQVFAPSGGRLASIPILTDGLGPRDVFLRSTGGRLLAHYRTAGWFGAIDWESARALLLDTNGAEKSATVRCVVAATASGPRDCDPCRTSVSRRPTRLSAPLGRARPARRRSLVSVPSSGRPVTCSSPSRRRPVPTAPRSR